MRVIVPESAEDDIDRHFSYIEKVNPAAAAKTVSRIRDQINRLETNSLVEMGHPGVVDDTRELIEDPYIIVYRIFKSRDEVHVVAVVHGAQDR